MPYSSGAAKALGKVIPDLDGRLTGYSLRVPVPVVSIVDLTVTLKRPATVEEINAAFRAAAASGPLKGILGYSDEPLVSSDYRGDARSSIIDGLSTLVIGGNLVKVLAWYDNEWGVLQSVGRSGAADGKTRAVNAPIAKSPLKFP